MPGLVLLLYQTDEYNIFSLAALYAEKYGDRCKKLANPVPNVHLGSCHLYRPGQGSYARRKYEQYSRTPLVAHKGMVSLAGIPRVSLAALTGA